LKSFSRDETLVKNIVQGTIIGYDFVFEITETNNAGTAGDPGSLAFKRKGTGSNLLKLDLTASAEKTRKNTRSFRIIEDLNKLYDAKCPREAMRANWVYPITGSTGLSEVVSTFIKLEKLGNLQHQPPANFKDGENVVFSDVLKFTTTLDATMTPTLTLTPVVGRFKVTNASITGEAKRMDIHTVIVALARDNVVIVRPPPGAPEGREFVRRQAASPRAAAARVETERLIEMEAVREARTVRALVQRDSEAYTRVLIELQRLRNLEDDDREAPRLLGEKILEILRTP
jgi:hypothetical protein